MLFCYLHSHYWNDEVGGRAEGASLYPGAVDSLVVVVVAVVMAVLVLAYVVLCCCWWGLHKRLFLYIRREGEHQPTGHAVAEGEGGQGGQGGYDLTPPPSYSELDDSLPSYSATFRHRRQEETQEAQGPIQCRIIVLGKGGADEGSVFLPSPLPSLRNTPANGGELRRNGNKASIINSGHIENTRSKSNISDGEAANCTRGNSHGVEVATKIQSNGNSLENSIININTSEQTPPVSGTHNVMQNITDPDPHKPCTTDTDVARVDTRSRLCTPLFSDKAQRNVAIMMTDLSQTSPATAEPAASITKQAPQKEESPPISRTVDSPQYNRREGEQVRLWVRGAGEGDGLLDQQVLALRTAPARYEAACTLPAHFVLQSTLHLRVVVEGGKAVDCVLVQLFDPHGGVLLELTPLSPAPSSDPSPYPNLATFPLS